MLLYAGFIILTVPITLQRKHSIDLKILSTDFMTMYNVGITQLPVYISLMFGTKVKVQQMQ